MEGIKEWWSPIFFSSHRTFCLFLSFSPSHVLLLCQSYQVWWSDTRQDWAQRARAGGVSERKKDEEEQQSNYLLLADIYPALLSPPPHVTPFVRSLFPTYIFSLDSSDCLLPCYLSLSILSAFFCFPWSPHLPCFAFLYLAFHLTLPYSAWFYFFPPRCLIRLLSFILRPSPRRPQRCSPFLNFNHLDIYRKFPVHSLLPAYPVLFLHVTLQNNIMWHMYWVLTLFSSPSFWSLWYELTHVLTQ